MVPRCDLCKENAALQETSSLFLLQLIVGDLLKSFNCVIGFYLFHAFNF